MKKKIFDILKIVVPISIGIFLVLHIYNQLDSTQRQAVFDSFKRANYFWIILSILMGVTSHWVRGYRWKYQLSAMGYHPRVFNNFMAVMIGYIVNMILPRVGELSRAAAITQYENVPVEKSFGSILAERAIDFMVVVTVTIVTVFLQYDLLRDFVNEIFDKLNAKANSPLLWGLAVFALILGVLFYFLVKRFSHLKIFAKISSLFQGLVEGLVSIFKMKKRVQYLLATLLIWSLYLGMFWICFFSLNETSSLGPNAVFAGFVLGSFAIILIPGGIGAYPVSIMQCLMLYGIAEETGFALGWIIWLSQTAMILIFGGLSMLYMPYYNKKFPAYANPGN